MYMDLARKTFMALCVTLLIGFSMCNNTKPVRYRIERFTFKDGKGTGGRMEHDCEKMDCVGADCEAYSCKYGPELSANMGYDSVIFVIVKQ